jgi:hypothetical protein
MKGNRSLVAITLALSLAILPSALAVEKTSTKAAGPSSTKVVNTILSGAGLPSKTLGINGDFYIDTKNLNLYGPKTKGVWKLTTSLKPKEPAIASVVTGDTGPSGSKGDTGEQGGKGEKGLTGDKGAIGDKGATGARGLQGIQGVAGWIGATGSTGTPGVAGAKGDTGTQGIQGIQGAKGDTGTQGIQGIQGAKGDTGTQGIQGVKGETGSQGTQGVKGDTGLPGDAGISVAKFAIVPFATLAITTAGNSTSQAFFTASSSGNYTFEVIVSGIARESDVLMLNAQIVVENSPITNQFAIASDAVSNANGSPGRQFGFTVIGAAAGVSAGEIFSLRITNRVEVSGGASINFIGRALVNKVGSIG